jgi:hypothetical protein
VTQKVVAVFVKSIPTFGGQKSSGGRESTSARLQSPPLLSLVVGKQEKARESKTRLNNVSRSNRIVVFESKWFHY